MDINKSRGRPARNWQNQKLGNLEIISKTDSRDSGGRVIWEALCACGEKIEVVPSRIPTPKLASCSCSRGKYLSGEVVRGFELIRATEDRSNERRVIWECRCVTCEEEYRLSTLQLDNPEEVCTACIEEAEKEEPALPEEEIEP